MASFVALKKPAQFVQVILILAMVVSQVRGRGETAGCLKFNAIKRASQKTGLNNFRIPIKLHKGISW
jgi:hypothetical protein